MKYPSRAGTLLVALFSLALFSSCGKGNKCGQTLPIVIDHNGPLSEGQLEVSFCSVGFHNAMGMSVVDISARIVQP